ncbi:MAG TPA: YqjK family protein [Burkholderiales bacterium]|nr:YqjK family protein [Burkholderiales bacterium]
MSSRSDTLARKRQALIARAERERVQLAQAAQGVKAATRIADRVITIARYLRAHPLLVGIAAAALVLAGRGRALRWAVKALPAVSIAMRLGRGLVRR